jgi:hypothetical protein
MRMIVSGIRDNRSCVLKEIDCPPQGEGMSTLSLIDLEVGALPPRPPGKSDFVDIPVPVGMLRWYRVRFQPNQMWGMHHTDTIDCHTIVAGSIDLILDDGPHRLTIGDSAIVTGVDHAWQAGPEGCATSIVILGTPKP